MVLITASMRLSDDVSGLFKKLILSSSSAKVSSAEALDCYMVSKLVMSSDSHFKPEYISALFAV